MTEVAIKEIPQPFSTYIVTPRSKLDYPLVKSMLSLEMA